MFLKIEKYIKMCLETQFNGLNGFNAREWCFNETMELFIVYQVGKCLKCLIF